MRQPMCSLLAAITLFLMSTAVLAQDLLMTPKWKRDDIRTLYVSQTRTLPGNNEEGEPVDVVMQYNTSAKVKVYDINPEAVLISIDYENVVIPTIRPYFEGPLPGELDPYKRMIIRYEVDRTSGEARLLNAADLREFVHRAADISHRTIRKKDPEAAAEIEQELGQMVAQFNDPALAEEFVDQRVGFLMLAFGKPLDQGAPLEEEKVQPNPFGAPGDSVLVSSKMSLQQLSGDQATIKLVQSMAIRQLVAAKKGSAPARPANDQAVVQILRWSQEQMITVDTKTTWPTRAVRETSIEMSDGRKGTEQVSIEVR